MEGPLEKQKSVTDGMRDDISGREMTITERVTRRIERLKRELKGAENALGLLCNNEDLQDLFQIVNKQLRL